MSIVEASRNAQRSFGKSPDSEDSDPVILKFPSGKRIASTREPSRPLPLHTSSAQTVAIVLPSWIGDVVMATPALRALREHFGPEVHLVGLVRPYVASVLEGTPWLNETLLYSYRSSDRTQQTRAIAAELRTRQIDTMVLMNRSLHTCLLAHLSRAKKRIGYGGKLHRLLLRGQRVPQQRGEQHSPLDCYLSLASTITGRLHNRKLELATTRDDELAADLIWHRLGLHESRQTVVLNCGSATGDSRHWPLASFSSLARQLAERRDCSVLVACGPKETEAATQVAAAANHPRVHSMAGQDLSLGTAKACLRRADLLVSTDSGPRHIAAAFDVPTVSLLGPMGDHLSQNYHAKDLRLRADVDCAPCGQHSCPLLHQRCMRDLRVDRVLAASLSQLAPTAPRRMAA